MQFLSLRVIEADDGEQAIKKIEDGIFVNWHNMSDIVHPISGLDQVARQLYKLLDSKLYEYQYTKYYQDIEETLDMVLVLYLGEIPDGDRQNEIADSMDEMNVLDAIEELSNRLASLPEVEDEILIDKLCKRGYIAQNLFHDRDIESENKKQVKRLLYKNFDANEGINLNTIKNAINISNDQKKT